MLVFDVIQVTQVLRRVDGGKVVRSCAFIAMLSVEYVLVGSDANGFSGLACLLSGKSGPISVFGFFSGLNAEGVSRMTVLACFHSIARPPRGIAFLRQFLLCLNSQPSGKRGLSTEALPFLQIRLILIKATINLE